MGQTSAESGRAASSRSRGAAAQSAFCASAQSAFCAAAPRTAAPTGRLGHCMELLALWSGTGPRQRPARPCRLSPLRRELSGRLDDVAEVHACGRCRDRHDQAVGDGPVGGQCGGRVGSRAGGSRLPAPRAGAGRAAPGHAAGCPRNNPGKRHGGPNVARRPYGVPGPPNLWTDVRPPVSRLSRKQAVLPGPHRRPARRRLGCRGHSLRAPGRAARRAAEGQDYVSRGGLGDRRGIARKSARKAQAEFLVQRGGSCRLDARSTFSMGRARAAFCSMVGRVPRRRRGISSSKKSRTCIRRWMPSRRPWARCFGSTCVGTRRRRSTASRRRRSDPPRAIHVSLLRGVRRD